jgi:hypothetical protein
VRVAIVTVAAVVTLLLPSAGAAQPLAKPACIRDTPATIGGVHKCLGAGEYCKLAYQRQYERYGFICSSRYSPPRLRRM